MLLSCGHEARDTYPYLLLRWQADDASAYFAFDAGASAVLRALLLGWSGFLREEAFSYRGDK